MKISKVVVLFLTAALFLTGCDLFPETSTEYTQESEQTQAPSINVLPVPIGTTEATQATEMTQTTQQTEPTDSHEETNSNGRYKWKPVTLSDKIKNADPSKIIALTFDDGPSTNTPASTERILDVLEEYGCKATFFVQGINMTYAEFKERNTALVKREADMGMEIGSHSFDHPYFNKISADEIKKQLDDSIKLIEDATGGYRVRIMRCPGGAEKQSVKDAVDMPMISWNIDTLDWDTKDPDKTYNNIMSSIKGGSIVLMHDTYKATADAVERVVPELVSRGYILVTVSELFTYFGIDLEPHTVYYSAHEYR